MWVQPGWRCGPFPTVTAQAAVPAQMQGSEATSGVYYLSFLMILLSFIWLLFFILNSELSFA